ncbi:hypothetical protein, partial [Phenylobacterium sp.]|uniref:hypothetical protein n=1 Tax=Phenylobacterium sp. TaxID=1871053 RepID=UPI002F42D9D4
VPMAANHRLSFDVECPTCGATGRVVAIEEAGPPFADAPRRTYSAGSFGVGAGNPATIECAACGAKFPGKF